MAFLVGTRPFSKLLAAGVAAVAIAACSAEKPAALAGTTADNFLLVDQTGIAHSLKYDKAAPAIVLVMQQNGDEGSRAAAKQAEELAKKYPNVPFKLINSVAGDTREAIAAEAKEQGITLPVLDDEFQLVGDSLGATYAGEAFAIDTKTWKVAYHGPVSASKGGLDAALAELTTAKPVTVAEVSGKGTKLEFADRANKAEFAKISYATDVAPILMKRCVDCHQPGGIAPWQMTSYEAVKGFSPMIREAIRTDRMPPYDVDRHVGAFQSDENMSEQEIKTIVHWIEAGAPRGEGDDPLAKGVTQRAEWPLGTPDLVMAIPEYDIPASGVVDYQMPAIASPLKEAKWLKATTFKAGSRQGVHHILAGWMPKMPANGRGFDWKVSMGGYAVGSESNLAPKDWATYIPAGGAISFQMHYTPFGKAIRDNSKIAFYFQPEAPQYLKRQIVVIDPSITITPGEARHHETSYVQFPAAVQLYAAQPHAHYRGYASKLTAIYPDGKEQLILNMPKYDFNWQREYIFKDLIDLPAGTKLKADYWYDNSANNPANPDPAKLVEWGDQSFEEMLFTGVQFRWADETATKRMDDVQEQFEMVSQMFSPLDDNMDGVLTADEFKSKQFEDFKTHFAQIDANQDGKLDPKEYFTGMEAMQKQAAAQRRRGGAGSGGQR